MMKIVLYLILVILYMLTGAWNISEAIDSFKKQKYSWFGWYIIIILLMVALMFRIVFKYV